jgi:hypothetical protein
MTVLGANLPHFFLLGVTASGIFWTQKLKPFSAAQILHLTVAALPSSASLFCVEAAHHALGDLLPPAVDVLDVVLRRLIYS